MTDNEIIKALSDRINRAKKQKIFYKSFGDEPEEVLKEIDKMLENIERSDEIDEKSKYEAYCFDTI